VQNSSVLVVKYKNTAFCFGADVIYFCKRMRSRWKDKIWVNAQDLGCLPKSCLSAHILSACLYLVCLPISCLSAYILFIFWIICKCSIKLYRKLAITITCQSTHVLSVCTYLVHLFKFCLLDKIWADRWRHTDKIGVGGTQIWTIWGILQIAEHIKSVQMMAIYANATICANTTICANVSIFSNTTVCTINIDIRFFLFQISALKVPISEFP
jgi:hypothetical protein